MKKQHVLNYKTFVNESSTNKYYDYEILYSSNEKFDSKSLGLVEYDSTSNKPFMVYLLNTDTMDYEPFSGEDDLDTAINVVDSEI